MTDGAPQETKEKGAGDMLKCVRQLGLAIAGAATLSVGYAGAQEPDAGLGGRAAPVAPGPALEWRFVSGPGVEGAMRLSDEASERTGGAIGHFVLNVVGRGFYEGVYNVREDGASLVGVFWGEGRPLDGPIDGFLDIGASIYGPMTSPPLRANEAVVTFVTGETLNGALAQ